jgi:hypothetical protein
MTGLARLDGPQTAAVRDQLVEVYRAAMSAPPFHETDVETGWFAEELADELTEAGYRCWVAREDGGTVVGFAYGFPTSEVPPEGWYGLLRKAVGPDGADHWLAGQFAVVWIAVRPDRPAPGPHGRAHASPRPAAPVPRWGSVPLGVSAYRSGAPSVSSGGSRRCRRRPGRRRRTW